MADEQFEEQSRVQKTLDPHCFSCDMPMKDEKDFGTNADGTKNEEYCCHCMVNGEKR